MTKGNDGKLQVLREKLGPARKELRDAEENLLFNYNTNNYDIVTDKMIALEKIEKRLARLRKKLKKQEAN